MVHYICPECDKEGKTPEDIKKNGCACKIQPIQMLDPEDHDNINKKKKSPKKNLDEDNRSEQKKLYDFALTRMKN